jgi:glycosyltransferase involved in cell wall biosynthesis
MNVVAFFNAHTEGVAGGDIRFIEIMERLNRKKRVSLIIVTSFAGKELCVRRKLKGIYVITTKEHSPGNVFVLYFKRIMSALSLKLNIKKETILYSTSDFLPDVLPILILKFKNKSIGANWVANVYHIIPHPFERPGGLTFSNLFSFVTQRISLYLIAKWSDIIFTETSFVKDKIVKQYKISAERIIVCPSGINPEVIDNFSWSRGKIYDACFLGRLHKSKGIYDLIETWKYVCKHSKDAKLAIAGNGSPEIISELKHRIKSAHLENNVFYLGFLSEEDKYKLLKASKLYVLPSHEEGIPITFCEAMYCGLPVVTYYLPTYSDIKNYIVSVPLGNVTALGNEVLRVLNDVNLFRALSEKGRGFAREHTWDKVAESILYQISKANIDKCH